MRKSKGYLKDFELRMGLYDKAEKWWFWVTFTLLCVYVECVVFAQNTVMGQIDSKLFNVFQAVVVVPICFVVLLLVSKFKISGDDIRAKDRTEPRKQLIFTAFVCLLTFLIYFICQRAYWPGAFNPDSMSQYRQILEGSYSNWHPVLHTWLFLLIPFKIFHSPAGIVLFQIVCFSFAVAYLFYVLYTSGCPKLFLVCGWLYIALNPNTTNFIMYPWKDSAMAIFSMVVFAQLVRIYRTEGAWLKKWYNLAAFSVFAFLTLEMRHNAILLVAPIFLIVFCFFKPIRKRVLLSAFLIVLAHLLLQGPIFSLANVSQPGNRKVETLGLPMTILSDIYVQDREALSEDARDFMDSLATQEQWEDYRLGSFNSVKFYTDVSPVEEAGYQKILQYTADAAMKRPGLAWKAFCLLTCQVWEFDGGNGWSISAYIEDNPYGIHYHGNTQLRDTLSTYRLLTSFFSMKYLFRYAGVIILLLLFLAVGNLGRGNLSRALLVLAPMMYNFGTMLLLTGEDFRFFHFNFIIVIPLIYLVVQRKGPSDDIKNQESVAERTV